jgi:hypothetical protein
VTLRRIVANLLLLSTSLLLVLGAIEVVLRVLYPPPARFFYPQESYDFDPETGFVLRPGQKAFTHDRPVHINALGLRDREIASVSPTGLLRVLALGDSQTFGSGLDLADTWPKQLERMLQVAEPARWEVVNAGIPGTDTWQHEILLGRLLKTLKPHVVVLALYVNDIVPRHDPRSVDASAQTNTWGKRLAYLLKRSAVMTWMYHRVWMPWSARRAARGGSVEEAVLAGRNDPRAERGWQQVEQSLAVMKEACDAQGATLLVVILPRRDQVSGAHPGRAYNVRARAITRAHGIDAIDVLEDLSAAYHRKGDALFVPWDGHNSTMANEVIATRLVPAMGLASRAR